MDVDLVVVILNVRRKYCHQNIVFQFVLEDRYISSPRLFLPFI